MIGDGKEIGRAFVGTARLMVAAALLAPPLTASSVAAQQANKILLDATYLDAPTDWCPADAGFPLVVKMDGPDIMKVPKRVSLSVMKNLGRDVGKVDSSGKFEDFLGPNAEVIGRFSAEFRTCFNPWSTPHATGSWQLLGNDGSNLDQGVLENELLGITNIDTPFFTYVLGPSDARYAQFGERLLFTTTRPETTVTQIFLAEPDKE